MDIRDGGGSTPCSPTRGGHRARHSCGRPALARLGGARPAHRLHHQRERHAQPARGHAPPLPRGNVHLHLDEQGLRRPARTACRSSSSTRGSSSRGPRVLRRHRHAMSIDRSTHSLFGVSKVAADLVVQEYGRYFGMPTVCFRGGCLTGPNHAGAQLHGFLAYLMNARSRASPTRSSATAASRYATTSTAPTSSRAFAAFHASAARGGRLQHGRRPRQQLLDARGDRPLRARSPAGSSTGAERPGADRRPPLVDQRPGRFRADYPGWELEYGVERHPARDPRPERRALGRAHGAT